MCRHTCSTEWQRDHMHVMSLSFTCHVMSCHVYVTSMIRHMYCSVPQVHVLSCTPDCTKSWCLACLQLDIVFFGESLPERFFKLLQQVCMAGGSHSLHKTNTLYAPLSPCNDLLCGTPCWHRYMCLCAPPHPAFHTTQGSI